VFSYTQIYSIKIFPAVPDVAGTKYIEFKQSFDAVGS
jgi:hypothetical protein